MSEKPLILLVDDDREIVRGLGLRLRAAGYEIMGVHDGQAGLAAAIEFHPDAIVLDIRMPVMDGLTMLARLHEQKETAAIPAVVLSANIAETAKNKALELGAYYFIEKPYDPTTLIEAIQSALSMEPPTVPKRQLAR